MMQTGFWVADRWLDALFREECVHGWESWLFEYIVRKGHISYWTRRAPGCHAIPYACLPHLDLDVPLFHCCCKGNNCFPCLVFSPLPASQVIPWLIYCLATGPKATGLINCKWHGRLCAYRHVLGEPGMLSTWGCSFKGRNGKTFSAQKVGMDVLSSLVAFAQSV